MARLATNDILKELFGIDGDNSNIQETVTQESNRKSPTKQKNENRQIKSRITNYGELAPFRKNLEECIYKHISKPLPFNDEVNPILYDLDINRSKVPKVSLIIGIIVGILIGFPIFVARNSIGWMVVCPLLAGWIGVGLPLVTKHAGIIFGKTLNASEGFLGCFWMVCYVLSLPVLLVLISICSAPIDGISKLIDARIKKEKKETVKIRFQYLKEMNQKGVPNSIYELAMMYLHGWWPAKENFSRAIELFIKAANGGHVISQELLKEFKNREEHKEQESQFKKAEEEKIKLALEAQRKAKEEEESKRLVAKAKRDDEIRRVQTERYGKDNFLPCDPPGSCNLRYGPELAHRVELPSCPYCRNYDAGDYLGVGFYCSKFSDRPPYIYSR